MNHRLSTAARVALVAFVVSCWMSPVRADLLYTRNLCAPGGSFNIGTNWVTLPTQSDMMTAEMLCLAIPDVTTVAQHLVGSPPMTSPSYQYDCATGACTSSTGVIPEPGCTASTCFCVDKGEGIEVHTTQAAAFPVNGCDTFETVTLPAGFQRFLISVPIDTWVTNWNELAVALALPTTGITRGTVTGINCATGIVTQCNAGTAACSTLTIIPGEAYSINTLTSAGWSYTSPAACSPIAPPAAADCPLGDLTFVDSTTLTWSPPAGCVAPTYDVIRNEPACLRNFCTNNLSPVVSPTCPACVTLLTGSAATTVSDAATPPVGGAYWYLARATGGTWNPVATDMKCTDFDLMLTGSCP